MTIVTIVIKLKSTMTQVNNCPTIETKRICLLIIELSSLGRCFCEEGYAGSDCRVLLGEPPQSVALLNGGLCDRSLTNCSWSVVLGQAFLDTTNLSCRLQQVEVRTMQRKLDLTIRINSFNWN